MLSDTQREVLARLADGETLITYRDLSAKDRWCHEFASGAKVNNNDVQALYFGGYVLWYIPQDKGDGRYEITSMGRKALWGDANAI